MNIYQKIVEIRKTIDVFTKDTKGFGYSYVSGAQVLKKIKEKMDESQVVLEPHVLTQSHNTFDYVNDKGKHKTDFIIYGDMEYHWVNAEEPSDRIVVKWQLFGQQDDISKAFGSGLTYSERYFLLKYFGIPTDEDDPDARQTGGKQQVRKASDKQLDLINNLLERKVSQKHSKDQLYQSLKERLSITDEMENWSSSIASQAIGILQGKGEQAS